MDALQGWFRVSPAKNNNAFIAVYNLLSLLGDTHYPTFLVGITSIMVILGLKLYRRTRKVPGQLVAVVLYIVVMVIWTQAIDVHGTWVAGLGHLSL